MFVILVDPLFGNSNLRNHDNFVKTATIKFSLYYYHNDNSHWYYAHCILYIVPL